ncbi:helix-turn-helix domain-containing protein [Paenibacillus radicis (ex Gao et al. 2016)]|uniref:helix-turn-helix domain-containing protein n=1 Tax=Paenibacillus radicis (ex Gao et al. 2016) TaxID=1737354 RepID=UPI001E36AE09|nr:helix-turn-helix domain-containing protein [Paenibacillus radicis (ex Gao et al. 2016)]
MEQFNQSQKQQVHKDLAGRGILYRTTRKFQVARYEPCVELRPFIRHYWMIEWDLTGEPPYKQEVLQNPVINLVFEKDQTRIFGVERQRSYHMLEGIGHVLGVHFLPGGFYPFYGGRPVSDLTDSSASLEDVFGCSTAELEHEVLSQPDHAGRIGVFERFLLERLPVVDDNIAAICAIIDRIIAERQMTKVEHVMDGLGMSKRTLQRLFNQYVGVSPKWVIQRYRMLEAAELAAGGKEVDWSSLAAELGFFDQAHFIKAFKALVGVSPDSYARQL